MVQWVVQFQPGCLPTTVVGAEKPNSPSVWGARTALAPRVFIAFRLYYDATHTLTKPFRLALYAFCLMLVLLCIRALGRYA
jgi:hypothetical protein